MKISNDDFKRLISERIWAFLWDKNGIFHRVYIIDVYYVEVRLYEIKKICGKELVYSAFFMYQKSYTEK